MGEGKKQKIRNGMFLLAAVLLLLVAVWLLTGWNPGRQNRKTLTVGVFSDSYWGVQNGYSYQILEDAINRFEEQNQGVQVEYVSGVTKEDYMEWLSEQILQGTAPDIFFLPQENVCEFAEAGALKDLTGMLQKSPDFDSTRYYTSALQAGMYNGEFYALPYECAPRLMFVNKTILEQEGIAMPDKD